VLPHLPRFVCAIPVRAPLILRPGWAADDSAPISGLVLSSVCMIYR
jgi:hypothetical protein